MLLCINADAQCCVLSAIDKVRSFGKWHSAPACTLIELQPQADTVLVMMHVRGLPMRCLGQHIT